MCKKCDNPEGNLCNACEREVQEVKHEGGLGVFSKPPAAAPIVVALHHRMDWWPDMVVGRSINIASSTNDAPKELIYV
jgi:hypothetical protein